MARPSFIEANLAEGAVITQSNESSLYLPEYAVDRDYARPVKWTADGSNWIEFDLTDSLEVDSLFFGNHNLPQTGFSMSVKGGASPTPTTVLDSPVWREKGVLASWTAGNYRYIRVEFSSTQPTLYPEPQAGQIVVGKRVVLPRGVRFGENRQVTQAGINRRTNRGKRYAIELHRLERFEIAFRYPESERASFLSWWETMEGMLYPFVWVRQDGGTEGVYVAIDEMGFVPQELPEQATDPVEDWKLVLMEEGLGAEILD